MKQNTEQCKDCVYWRSGDGQKTTAHFCHHLLVTRKRRKKDGAVCLSKKSEI